MDRGVSTWVGQLAIVLYFFAMPLASAAADAQQIAPPLTPNQLATESASELEQQGDQMRYEKRYLDSIDFYAAANAKHPSATVWNKEGIAYLLLAHMKEAQKCFDTAMKLEPESPEGYNNRAYIEQHKKNYGKAIKYYKKALLLNPHSADFHYNIATVYFDRKDYKQSATEYRAAFGLDSGIFERHARTGILARPSTEGDRATYLFMLAKMYAAAGDTDRSLTCLRKAMEEGFREYKKVYNEPEFATLRTDKRFSELMAQKPQPIQ